MLTCSRQVWGATSQSPTCKHSQLVSWLVLPFEDGVRPSRYTDCIPCSTVPFMPWNNACNGKIFWSIFLVLYRHVLWSVFFSLKMAKGRHFYPLKMDYACYEATSQGLSRPATLWISFLYYTETFSGQFFFLWRWLKGQGPEVWFCNQSQS